MTEHPSIAAMMNSGYEYPEPPLFAKCTNCGSEIFVGEEYIEHGGNAFCEGLCLQELMFKEGNAVKRVAGE